MRGMNYPEYQTAIRDREAHAGQQGETAGAIAVAAADLRPYEIGETGGPYPDKDNIAAYWTALIAFEIALTFALAATADFSEDEASAFRYAFNRAFFAPLTIFVQRQSPSC